MSQPANRGPADKPQLNRRDLLRGRLWKLLRPATYKSLVMRYPKHRDDIPAGDPNEREKSDPPAAPSQVARPRKTIGGISIEPVAATPLATSGRPPSLPVFRPPGAVEESQFLAGCTRCGDCIAACPHDAMQKAPEGLGQISSHAVAGTPVIDADVQACRMCEDFPCISACPTGVLTSNIPILMGTARITEHLCLPYHGTACTVCSERCPVGHAIAVVDGKPTVHEDNCSGCGVCRQVCPAPENAVLLMPTFSRPPVSHPPYPKPSRRMTTSPFRRPRFCKPSGPMISC